jgi:putative N6-adenine-specific DNA methylase
LASRSAKGVLWNLFLRQQDRVFVKTTCHASAVYHDKAASERVLEAACFAVSCVSASGADDATATIFVRMDHDICTLSIDATGPMHQRGYRQETGKAPLRETWAATVLLLAGWDGSVPLLDPMCGSGTLPIEAACIAACIPAGRMRSFPFLNWPACDEGTWIQIKKEAEAQMRLIRVPVWGADRDAGVIDAARRNAQRAGVDSWVSFECRPVSATPPMTGPGMVVCNPPWGLRIGERRQLRDLYAALGNTVRVKLPQFDVALLTPHEHLAQATQLPFGDAPAMSFPSGGTRVFVFLTKKSDF